MDYNKIIKEIGRGKHHARDLDRETAYTLYRAMLADEAGDGDTGPRIAAAAYRHSQLQRRA